MARQNDAVVIECVDCGTSFEVSTEEQQWYKDKGFDLPKRCPRCRKSRRNQNNNKKRK